MGKNVRTSTYYRMIFRHIKIPKKAHLQLSEKFPDVWITGFWYCSRDSNDEKSKLDWDSKCEKTFGGI